MFAVANVLGRARLLSAATAAAAAFLAFPAAAAHAATATPYPAPSSPGTVNTGIVGANGEVKFGGSGFVPSELIVITIKPVTTAPHAAPAVDTLKPHVQLIGLATAAGAPPATATTVTADKTGSFSAKVRMTTPGTFTLIATGQKSGHVVTATVKVVGGGSAGGGASGNGNGNSAGGKGAVSADGGDLSFTGSRINVAVSAWLGAGAIALGIAFLRLSTTRRRQAGIPETAVTGL
ncbi:MAG: hypothetical protein QOF57_2791 [Frankiaceae bacterium]|nr:hypothetical protein [Frankiaceae bacterium]